METKRLVIVAVGGQGNLLASSVLGEAALLCDIPLHMSEIHGMAQRGGVVESSLVFGDANSTIISDGDAPLMPFTVNIGQGVYPDLKELQELISKKTAKLIAFNAAALAKEAGNVLSVNMVLLGALIQTGILPLTVDQVKEAMKTKTKKAFLDSNLKAFDLGFSAAESA
jgi:indolepyruvate ferredoxin oxidoreductase beta subunit